MSPMHGPRDFEMLKPALAMIVLVIVVFGFFRLFGEHIYSCRAEASAVYFRLFGYVPLWKITYPEIIDVHPVTFGEVFSLKPFPFFFISRPGAQLVLIQRNG